MLWLYLRLYLSTQQWNSVKYATWSKSPIPSISPSSLARGLERSVLLNTCCCLAACTSKSSRFLQMFSYRRNFYCNSSNITFIIILLRGTAMPARPAVRVYKKVCNCCASIGIVCLNKYASQLSMYFECVLSMYIACISNASVFSALIFECARQVRLVSLYRRFARRQVSLVCVFHWWLLLITCPLLPSCKRLWNNVGNFKVSRRLAKKAFLLSKIMFFL